MTGGVAEVLCPATRWARGNGNGPPGARGTRRPRRRSGRGRGSGALDPLIQGGHVTDPEPEPQGGLADEHDGGRGLVIGPGVGELGRYRPNSPYAGTAIMPAVAREALATVFTRVRQAA